MTVSVHTSEVLNACHLDIELSKFRTFTRNKITLLCHPSAKEAYLAWLSIPKIAPDHSQRTSSPTRTSIYLLEAPIKTNQPTYYFFESFDIVQKIALSQPDLILGQIIQETLEIEKVESLAWRELVKLLDSRLLDGNIGLPFLRDVINKSMPTNLMLQLLGTNKLTTAAICKGLGLSKRQFDYQQTKFKAWQTKQERTIKFDFNSILKRAAKCPSSPL